MLWEAADRICGKRLKHAIPALLDAMERHGHLELAPEIRELALQASVASIDRLLAPVRDAGKHGRRCNTVSTPLRKSIAIRTFSDWNDPPHRIVEVRADTIGKLDRAERRAEAEGDLTRPMPE